jgi:hypothetical protein
LGSKNLAFSSYYFPFGFATFLHPSLFADIHIAADAVPRWNDACDFEPLDFIARLASLVPQPRLSSMRCLRPLVSTGR